MWVLQEDTMDIEFNNVKELYERLIPALNTKVEELKRSDLDYIKAEDIWNYLKENKWSSAKDLLLYQMVDDILKYLPRIGSDNIE